MNTALHMLLFGAAASIPLVSATVTLDECSVPHASNGNTFQVCFGTIDDASESSICGSSDKAIRNSASRFSINVSCNTQCQTYALLNLLRRSNLAYPLSNSILGNKNTIVLEVKFDKQSPSTQRDALVNGLTAAFGSSGVNIDASKCNIADTPT
ncbi:hypothetical protein BDV96DRAFT_602567 [Lophiotrema nucula]|uniref:Uncharacterized protein n=1 Tax=Lophiotrema nucula TaxID=690887 RepID=A0A6A5YYZ6_9PLEO|nr:hypothetical protein BDV96DRAFT_602567 [Lophiotrema nucula]